MKKNFITLQIERNKYRKILFSEIVYCKAERCYSHIKTENAEYLYSKPLKILEEQINDSQFIRVNRSYIVNAEKCIELRIGKFSEVILQDSSLLKVTANGLQNLVNYFGIADL